MQAWGRAAKGCGISVALRSLLAGLLLGAAGAGAWLGGTGGSSGRADDLPALDRTRPFFDVAPMSDPTIDVFAPEEDPLPGIAGELRPGVARAVRRAPVSVALPADLDSLIVQLGDDVYARREEAQRRLIAYGPLAKGALVGAMRHADPEIRRRARRALNPILQQELSEQLAELIADPELAPSALFPLWSRYRQEIGEHREAVRLYVEMVRHERALLETAAAGDARLLSATLGLRLQQIQLERAQADAAKRKMPPAAIYAVLFISGDPELDVGDDAQGVLSLLAQSEFQQSLRENPGPGQAILGAWLRFASSPAMAYQKVSYGLRLNQPECVLPATQLLNDPATTGTVRMYAALAMARHGRPEHQGLLAPLLDDRTLCSQRITAVNGVRTVLRCEVRDFALLALLEITKQNPADYGFDSLRENPYTVYNVSTVGFDDDQKREAALAKWQDYAAEHPLPDPPKTPGWRRATPAAAALPRDREQAAEWDVADRQWQVRLSRVRDALETGRDVDAARLLAEILGSAPEGLFRPERSQAMFLAVDVEARRLLSTLPAEGRAAYVLAVQTAAQREFEAAVADGDLSRLERLTVVSPGTPAAQEAAWLLAQHALDQGRPLVAASWLTSLRGDPESQRLEPALSESWDHSRRESRLRSPEPGSGEASASSSGDWLQSRGDERGNARSLDHLPLLRPRWTQPVAREPTALAAIDELQSAYQAESLSALPAAEPLLVGGRIVYRTTGSLAAVDAATGALAWETPQTDSVDELALIENSERLSQAMYQGIEERLWADRTAGTLSSDGRRVFGVEDVGLCYGLLNQRTSVMPDGSRRLDAGWPQDFNRLAAYDVASGKLLWEVGGSNGPGESPLAGAFFLGPPLPLADRLFVLAEQDGQYVLIELDAARGRPLWRQSLGELEAPAPTGRGNLAALVRQGRPRSRLQGATPSYAHGVLICPAPGAGFSAIDLGTRRLLWAYRPLSDTQIVGRRWNPFVRMRGIADPVVRRDNRWAETMTVIAGDRVLLTPPDEDRLLCVELGSGRILWTAPRADALYLAGERSGIVVLAGRNKLRGLKLADGSEAWPALPLPNGSAPSGRGLLGAERLLLPIDPVGLWEVDILTGRALSLSRNFGDARLGNLIAGSEGISAPRRVVSQHAQGVQMFELLDDALHLAARGVEERPDDAQAWRRQGEILHSAGRSIEALTSLQTACRLAPDDVETAALLIEARLAALERDFAGQRDSWDALEAQLADDAPQRVALDRLLVVKMREAGETRQALEAALRLARRDEAWELESAESALLVRRDRWLQGAIFDLFGQLSPPERDEVLEALAAELAAELLSAREEALARGDEAPEANPAGSLARRLLSRRLAIFDRLPLATAWRAEWLQELVDVPDAAAERRWLRWLLAYDREAPSPAALAELASELQAMKRGPEASPLFAKLLAEYGDRPVRGSQTGRQLAAALPSDSIVRLLLRERPIWPLGPVEIVPGSMEPFNVNPGMALAVEHAPTSLVQRLSLDVQQRGNAQSLLARDSLGQTRWTIDMRNALPAQNGFDALHARSAGPLLMLQRGDSLAVVDVLGDPTPAVLWKQTLRQPWPGQPAGADRRLQVLANGMLLRMANPPEDEDLTLGPLTPHAATYLRRRQAGALDPRTGEELWARHDLPAGSVLAGDDERLFVVPRSSGQEFSQALVLRTWDGKELGYRRAPPASQWIGTFPGHVLTAVEANDRTTVTLYDLWEERELWTRTFEGALHMHDVGGGRRAFLDATGAFLLMQFPEARPLVDAQLGPREGVSEIHVHSSHDHFVLIANRPPTGGANLQALTSGYRGMIVHGTLFGFNARSGKLLWEHEVEQRGLDLSHPADVPILALGSRSYEQDRDGDNVVTRYTTRLEVLDKRSGKVLHQETLPGAVTRLQVTPDFEKRWATVNTTRSSLRFVFREPLEAAD